MTASPAWAGAWPTASRPKRGYAVSAGARTGSARERAIAFARSCRGRHGKRMSAWTRCSATPAGCSSPTGECGTLSPAPVRMPVSRTTPTLSSTLASSATFLTRCAQAEGWPRARNAVGGANLTNGVGMSAAAELVDRQIAAFRDRDLDGFLSCYADDVKIRDFGGDVLMDGKAAMRGQYGPLFRDSPQLSVEIPRRMDAGDYVIDEEDISGFILAGFPETMKAVVVYQVRDGLIQGAVFLM